MNDTHQHYGFITRCFHWTITVLVIWQFLKLGNRISDGEHWIGQVLVPWHISIGILLLVLGILRVYWAVKQRQRRPRHVGPEAPLVKGGHFLLHLVTVLLAITGILFMVGNGYKLVFFGVELIAKSETKVDWMISVGNLHSPLAWLLLALVAGHIVAALYHHFVVRDDTMGRMLS